MHTAYRTALEEAQAKQATYNGRLAQTGQIGNDFEVAEAKLGELSVRLLVAVAGKYGLDRNEYEQAGGPRHSDRERPGRGTAKAAAVAKAALYLTKTVVRSLPFGGDGRGDHSESPSTSD